MVKRGFFGNLREETNDIKHNECDLGVRQRPWFFGPDRQSWILKTNYQTQPSRLSSIDLRTYPESKWKGKSYRGIEHIRYRVCGLFGILYKWDRTDHLGKKPSDGANTALQVISKVIPRHFSNWFQRSRNIIIRKWQDRSLKLLFNCKIEEKCKEQYVRMLFHA